MAGEEPIAQFYRHLPDDLRAFCTSRSQEEAARFAMRKVTRIDESGVIVVFDGSRLKPGKDCLDVKDAGILFNEQEVAVFAVRKLKPVDLLVYDRGAWVSRKTECGLKNGRKRGLINMAS